MALSAEEIRSRAIKDVEIMGLEDDPIILKLKTLSLLGLVGKGKIPNTLMNTAMEMFQGKSSNKDVADDGNNMVNISKLMEIICENCLVEPTYEEIGDILTDDQKMEIFYYSQGGVKSLESFRKKSRDNVVIDNVEAV